MGGYSRVYLLQHFLIDVAAGAFIGIVFSYLL
ncbi:MAG: phosphatase PAP2 family protein [Cytophagales bacterium]|nr:phosphatase PAP2 family protein [Cytophagales bacterium]MCA6366876.1 phosphatase PAP2 family protein [Cytophagales bacterium]MCA6370932.1 phosphatase PAP2 family protein [Cytophagales bacterium]MCA6375349.1 phosphatase PAP2 family protein [Cytophagales bacterium]MCA6382050.1 phosphatase PAP2 family protein [Cytophagales bacterium]